MATGFSVMDALNKNSKAGVDESPRARFRTKDISIFKMYRNKLNFYDLADIEELAGDILMYGLKQNLEVVFEPNEQGEYRIVAGERRWLALKYLVKQGYKDFEIATCKLTTPQDEDEEQVEIIIANAYRTKSLKDVIEEEQRLKACLERMKTDGKKIKGYDLQSGRLRDVIASMLKMSKTKIAQIESVNNNLIPEFREELNNERLTFSAAYELSGMSPEMQQEALAKYKENGELSYTEIKDMKSPQKPEQEQDAAGQQDTVSDSDTAGQQSSENSMNHPEEKKAGDDYETPHPEGITSICYSCTEYETCNVKTGTCTSCDQYKNRAEAYKTDEQRHSEEQDRIDKETAKKLREMEDDKKMQNLPSDESDKKKFIRMSVDGFERVVNGEQQYIITKNDGFKIGQEITIGEFAEGKATGRTLEMFISYMDDDKSSSALEDGYCVLSVHEAYRFCDQCEYFDRVNVSPDGMSACSHDTLNHYCEEKACHRFKRKRLHVDGGDE
jgi:ParB family chromosome partitioning protein